MSSKYVRNQIKSHISSLAPTETLVDFSAEFRFIEQLRQSYSLGPKDPFLGIQFLPSDEAPVSVVSNNNAGCYRENGVFLLHVVEAVSTNHRENILDRSETLLGLFRGATINGDIYIESVSYPNFDSSATVNFENGYQAAALVINFYRNNYF